ncbi:MAG: GH32 C-terminal domain-containing protein [Bacteroidia bacterium]|nr:GH32 C-terminal domain-containing protein [Bacteroidia bacterium]
MIYLRFYTILIALAGMAGFQVHAQPDTVAYWSMNEAAGIQITEAVSGESYLYNSHFSPEWMSGVSGTSIRLNGYASWVEGNHTMVFPENEFTISLWFALESYPVNTAALFSAFDPLEGKGFFVGVTKYGNITGAVNINGFKNNFTAILPVEKSEWIHLAVTVHTPTARVKVYVNGVGILDQGLTQGLVNWPANSLVYLGRHSLDEKVGIFTTNIINGLLDEVVLLHEALPGTDILADFQAQSPATQPDLSIPSSRFVGDFHRPRYHAIPSAAWTNEPHGLVKHNGKYHIFYQKNANGPYWSQINWGHQSSTNLISWKEESPVIWPQPGYDQFGIWSGDCVIDNNGNPVAIYTGVDGAKASMCIATGNNDLTLWQKNPGNPIISGTPPPYVTMDFRDPYLWKEGNNWYMVIGSGLVSSVSGGTAFLYRSTDLYNWTYIRPFLIGQPSIDNAGIFWEMPVVQKFGSKYLFLVNKVPEPPNKPADALYWTGTFQNEKFTPDYISPKKLELMSHFLSPSVTTDSLGRVIAIGIIPDQLPPAEQFENGWANLYSLPRVWNLSPDGQTLEQAPLPELSLLRGKHYHYSDLAINSGQTNNLGVVSGHQLEIKATINPNNSMEMGIVIARNPSGTEQTVIAYNSFFQFLTIDRSISSTNNTVPRDPVSVNYALPSGQPFDLHIFLDGSVVEVFVNEKAAFASRIYPEDSLSQEVDLYVSGGSATFSNVDIWEMRDMNHPTVGLADEMISPEGLRLQIAPNPSSGTMEISCDFKNKASTRLEILDLHGVAVKTFPEEIKVPGKQVWLWDGCGDNGEKVPPQVYISVLKIDNDEVRTGKLIIQR